MKRNHGWVRVCLAVFAVLLTTAQVWAQTATPEEEYKKRIKVDQDIHPLGEHPFGEDISLTYGSLSFHATDVSASGTGPLLTLRRIYRIVGEKDLPNRQSTDAFGDWILDLPRIETYVASGWVYDGATGHDVQMSGWTVENSVSGGDMNMRCKNFNKPFDGITPILSTPTVWGQDEWWRGYHLVIPGSGSQNVFLNMDSSTSSTFPAVTKNHWRLSCIDESSTKNGVPGDGFIAHAPDGTKYYFNELVYRFAPGVSKPAGVASAAAGKNGKSVVGGENLNKLVAGLTGLLTGSTEVNAEANPNGTSHLGRADAWMLVTKIEDRFGNTLSFDYNGDGRLVSIKASDGRLLAVHYDSSGIRIDKITLQPASGEPRTWTYAYATDDSSYGTTLTTVMLPDGSKWHYGMQAFDNASQLLTGNSTCNTIGTPYDSSVKTATVVHPSGLTGTFKVKLMKHGRSYDKSGCMNDPDQDPDTSGSYAEYPKEWYDFTIIEREISGAGIPNRTWKYQYSSPNSSWARDCSNGSCPSTIWTDVIAPDDSTVRRTFSNKYGVTESHLLRTDFYSGAPGSSTLLRSVSNSYAPANTANLPASAGQVMQGFINVPQATQYSPLQKRVISQDGDTYTWQAEAYDKYVHVIREKRSNSIAGQAADERQTTYYNDTNLWVLGLPLQTDDLTTGETISRNVYDTGNDTLKSRYHFGQKVMDYTFYSAGVQTAGQLASFTDGDGNTTTLSNYKRGIPQQIDYADTTQQKLSVDDFGQIAAITDQASHTTSYQYDAVGRVTRIDYPSGGSVAWAPTTFDLQLCHRRRAGPGWWSLETYGQHRQRPPDHLVRCRTAPGVERKLRQRLQRAAHHQRHGLRLAWSGHLRLVSCRGQSEPRHPSGRQGHAH